MRRAFGMAIDLSRWRICKDRILSATSEDGLYWRKESGARIDVRRDPPFDDQMVYGCHVRAEAINSYRTFYQASTMVDGVWQSKIRTARSEDGKNWRDVQDTGISAGCHSLSARRVQSPHLVTAEGNSLMFFAGTGEDGVTRILSAVSRDGLRWKVNDRPVLTPVQCRRAEFPAVTGICDPAVVRGSDGGYRMLFSATHADEFSQSIMSATSRDLVEWSVDSVEGVVGREFEVANNPSIILDNGTYRVWFRCSNKHPLESNIYTSASPNGVSWSDAKRCLSYSKLRSLERHGIGFPFVMRDRGFLRMYYTGYWGNVLCHHAVRYYEQIHAARRAAGSQAAPHASADHLVPR